MSRTHIKHLFLHITVVLSSYSLALSQKENTINVCDQINLIQKELAGNIYPPGKNIKSFDIRCSNDTIRILQHTMTLMKKLEGSGMDSVIENTLSLITTDNIGSIRESSFKKGSIIINTKNLATPFKSYRYKNEFSEAYVLPTNRVSLNLQASVPNEKRTEHIDKLRFLLSQFFE